MKEEFKDRILMVDFGNEFRKLLTEWKRKVWAVLGRGGIKERLIYLLQEDVKELNKEDIFK